MNKKSFTKEFSPLDKFELMIIQWKKESQERLQDLNKRGNRRIPNERYAL